jgi:hydrogenase 3 maturation protease
MVMMALDPGWHIIFGIKTGKPLRPVKKWSPEHLVLVDAADMNLLPGEIRRIPKKKISTLHISTHALPLSLLMTHLQDTIKKIVLVGIQPKKITGGLSCEVQDAGKHLMDILKNEAFFSLKTL